MEKESRESERQRGRKRDGHYIQRAEREEEKEEEGEEEEGEEEAIFRLYDR